MGKSLVSLAAPDLHKVVSPYELTNQALVIETRWWWSCEQTNLGFARKEFSQKVFYNKSNMVLIIDLLNHTSKLNNESRSLY